MSFPAATSATDTSGSMFSCGTNTNQEEEEEKNQNFPQQETSPLLPIGIHATIKRPSEAAVGRYLVVVDEAGEELVLVGLAEGVVLALVLHELLDALEDELEVVLHLELVHVQILLLLCRRQARILSQHHPAETESPTLNSARSRGFCPSHPQNPRKKKEAPPNRNRN
jgi:hypothetical protein